MRATEEQIKTVEKMATDLFQVCTIEGSGWTGDEQDQYDALTAILEELRESRELLEAFQMGTFVVDGSVLVIVPAAGGFKIGDGSDGDDRRFKDVFDAWKAIQQQGE